MSSYPSSDSQAFAWQQPGFLETLNHSLMPRPAVRSGPKREKKEKDRLYKAITRRYPPVK